MNICRNCKYIRYIFKDECCISPHLYSHIQIDRITGKKVYVSETGCIHYHPIILSCNYVRDSDECKYYIKRIPILERFVRWILRRN